jgi:hypothetical protein
VADENVATLQVWLIGIPKPQHFKLPLDEAQRIQQTFVEAFEDSAQPAGSYSMSDGTLLRFAAIAATHLNTR